MEELTDIVVDHVKFKKIEGTLHLTNKNISWKSNTGNSSLSIHHHYFEIKHIQISFKSKVKILIGFYNLSWSIFEFVLNMSFNCLSRQSVVINN